MKTESIWRENVVSYASRFTWGLLWLPTRTHHTRLDITSPHRTMFTTRLIRAASVTLVFVLPTCRSDPHDAEIMNGARDPCGASRKSFSADKCCVTGPVERGFECKGKYNGEDTAGDEEREEEVEGGGDDGAGRRRGRHQVDEKHNTAVRNALLRLLCCWTVICSTVQLTCGGGQGWCRDPYSTSPL